MKNFDNIEQLPQMRRYRLDKNENPFSLPPAPREDLRELISSLDFNRYPDIEALALRKALGDYVGFGAESIFVGNGGDEILFLLFAALVKPGDRIVRLSPSFSQYEVYARNFGADEKIVPITPSEEGYSVSWEALLDAVAASSPKLVLLDVPNNPTGIAFEPEKLAELARICPGILVIDEAYGEFFGKSVLPLFKERGIPKGTLVLRTLSKAWGFAGLRLGYAVADEATLAVLNGIRSPFNVNLFTQEASRFLLGYREWMDSRVYSIRYIRDAFVVEVNRVEGWKARSSEGNYLLLESEFPLEEVESVFAKAGLDVKFPVLEGWSGNWVRVTVGREEEMRIVLESCREVAKNAKTAVQDEQEVRSA